MILFRRKFTVVFFVGFFYDRFFMLKFTFDGLFFSNFLMAMFFSFFMVSISFFANFLGAVLWVHVVVVVFLIIFCCIGMIFVVFVLDFYAGHFRYC